MRVHSLLSIFENAVTAKDTGDLTDSDESLFSGLEDSGSDSSDGDDDGVEEVGEGDVDSGVEEKNMKKFSKRDVKISEVARKEEGESKGKLAKPDSSVRPEQTVLTAPVDEHEEDTSDEEDIRNTVGNIPMEWYKDYPHIGYDLDGKKIYKPIRNKDELDEFLDKMENPDYWRTIPDKMTGTEIRLSDEQIDLIHRIQKGLYGDAKFNPHE
ncbi:hypothetical protein scyTo_0013456, partial [Scyliorhinus torazame]|nr:hypothetical protein [Scyliorhinus torazame]